MDQCTYCTVKGNLEKCVATPCSKHDSWYANQLRHRIDELEQQLQQKESK